VFSATLGQVSSPRGYRVSLTTDAVLVTACVIAAVIDVRTRRIPNVLTAALAVTALGLHAGDGIGALALATASGLVAFALGTIVFRLGWFGGGDVKLLAAGCCLVSYPNCIALVMAVLATGAVFSLAGAALQGRLVALIRSTAAVMAHGEPTERHALPYGVAIAGGSVVYSLLTLSPLLGFAG
jgi:prepilin peptidase CpaA